jgi:hypothetical protein
LSEVRVLVGEPNNLRGSGGTGIHKGLKIPRRKA